MNKKLLKGGLVATLPIMMMLAIVPTAMPTAHADPPHTGTPSECLATANNALDILVPEIKQNIADGLTKKLAGIEGKFLDDTDKTDEFEDKVQQYRDKGGTLA